MRAKAKICRRIQEHRGRVNTLNSPEILKDSNPRKSNGSYLESILRTTFKVMTSHWSAKTSNKRKFLKNPPRILVRKMKRIPVRVSRISKISSACSSTTSSKSSRGKAKKMPNNSKLRPSHTMTMSNNRRRSLKTQKLRNSKTVSIRPNCFSRL